MSLEEDKKALEGSAKKSGVKKTKNIAQQDILDLSREEDLQKLKDKYGATEHSFLRGIREDDELSTKCKKMNDAEILDYIKTNEGPTYQYYQREIKKVSDKKPDVMKKELDTKAQKQKSLKNPESYSKPEQQGSFDQKTYEKIVKEKGGPAGWEYAMNARKQAPATNEKETKPETKKVEEKTPDKKSEAPKEEKKEDKTPEKKPEATKEEAKPIEKSAEPKKEPEKKTDDKSKEEKPEKKSFRKKLFKKKESKEKKPGIFSKIGSGIKAIPHQTWNALSYAPRVAWKTAVYGLLGWYDNGLGKPELKKNRDKYASAWKWEQKKEK